MFSKFKDPKFLEKARQSERNRRNNELRRQEMQRVHDAQQEYFVKEREEYLEQQELDRAEDKVQERIDSWLNRGVCHETAEIMAGTKFGAHTDRGGRAKQPLLQEEYGYFTWPKW